LLVEDVYKRVEGLGGWEVSRHHPVYDLYQLFFDLVILNLLKNLQDLIL